MQEITKKVARFMMEVGWKHPELCGTLFAGQPPGLPQVLILQLMVSPDVSAVHVLVEQHYHGQLHCARELHISKPVCSQPYGMQPAHLQDAHLFLGPTRHHGLVCCCIANGVATHREQ